MNLKERVVVAAAVGGCVALAAVDPWRPRWWFVVAGVAVALVLVVALPAMVRLADWVGNRLARLSRRGGDPVDVHAEQAVAAMGGDMYAGDFTAKRFAADALPNKDPLEVEEFDDIASRLDPTYRQAKR